MDCQREALAGKLVNDLLAAVSAENLSKPTELNGVSGQVSVISLHLNKPQSFSQTHFEEQKEIKAFTLRRKPLLA